MNWPFARSGGVALLMAVVGSGNAWLIGSSPTQLGQSSARSEYPAPGGSNAPLTRREFARRLSNIVTYGSKVERSTPKDVVRLLGPPDEVEQGPAGRVSYRYGISAHGPFPTLGSVSFLDGRADEISGLSRLALEPPPETVISELRLRQFLNLVHRLHNIRYAGSGTPYGPRRWMQAANDLISVGEAQATAVLREFCRVTSGDGDETASVLAELLFSRDTHQTLGCVYFDLELVGGCPFLVETSRLKTEPIGPIMIDRIARQGSFRTEFLTPHFGIREMVAAVEKRLAKVRQRPPLKLGRHPTDWRLQVLELYAPFLPDSIHSGLRERFPDVEKLWKEVQPFLKD